MISEFGKLKPRRRTREVLGHAHGSDWDKRLVVSLEAVGKEDVIVLRPERTTRSVMIEAKDLYSYLLRCKANLASLERARERKAAKAERLARARQERAERRLFEN